MDNLYANYIKERLGKEVLSFRNAFITYIIDGEECYMEDIYVAPQARRKGVGTAITDEVVKRAKEAGCKYVTGSVDPTTNGATESMKALLSYGFKLTGLHGNLIVLIKPI